MKRRMEKAIYMLIGGFIGVTCYVIGSMVSDAGAQGNFGNGNFRKISCQELLVESPDGRNTVWINTGGEEVFLNLTRHRPDGRSRTVHLAVTDEVSAFRFYNKFEKQVLVLFDADFDGFDEVQRFEGKKKTSGGSVSVYDGFGDEVRVHLRSLGEINKINMK